jgi:hypothetical protein
MLTVEILQLSTPKFFLHRLQYRAACHLPLSLAYNISAQTMQKYTVSHSTLTVGLRIHCCRNVFTERLNGNGSGIFAYLAIFATVASSVMMIGLGSSGRIEVLSRDLLGVREEGLQKTTVRIASVPV